MFTPQTCLLGPATAGTERRRAGSLANSFADSFSWRTSKAYQVASRYCELTEL